MHYVQLQLTVQSFKQKAQLTSFPIIRYQEYGIFLESDVNILHIFVMKITTLHINTAKVTKCLKITKQTNKCIYSIARSTKVHSFVFISNYFCRCNYELGTSLAMRIHCQVVIGESVSQHLTALLYELICYSFVCQRRLLYCSLSAWQ